MYLMNVPTEKNMICYLEKPGLSAKIRITIINMLFSSVFLLKTRTILRSFWRTSFNNRGDYKSEFMFSTKVIVPWGMSQTWTFVLFTNRSDNWTPENKPTMSEKCKQYYFPSFLLAKKYTPTHIFCKYYLNVLRAFKCCIWKKITVSVA